MHYLYGTKAGDAKKLVATFDSEQQLRAYVRWATLQRSAEGTFKFEQGSALVGCSRWEESDAPQTADDAGEVPHNPSPSML
jgi:hypothetical protein